MRQYKLLTKSEDPPRMEKLFRYLITYLNLELSFANICKADKSLFPTRLLELLLLSEAVSKFCAYDSEFDFSYINIYEFLSKKLKKLVGEKYEFYSQRALICTVLKISINLV